MSSVAKSADQSVQSVNRQKIRLGMNIDHIATVRNARGGDHPDPVRAALLAEQAGADGITAHLREDRRHIRDLDISRLMTELSIPLNLEMAATAEMLSIALAHKPHAVCLVPEKREELTTEGGLNVAGQHNYLRDYVGKLSDAGSRVSLFIDADPVQIEMAAEIGAPVVELHTGTYCDTSGVQQQVNLQKLVQGCQIATSLGLECHMGHGLSFESVGPVAAIPGLVELNIGHFIIGEAMFIGLEAAILKMREMIAQGQQQSIAQVIESGI